MKTKVSKVILMFVLVMGFGLCLLNGEDHGDHWWKFHETSGTIAHDSIGNVNGTLHGGASFSSNGEGINLNGTNTSYVSFGKTVGQFGSNDFTVYLEFKMSDKSDYKNLYKIEHLAIVGNRTSSDHGDFFDIRMTNTATVLAEVDEDAKAKAL